MKATIRRLRNNHLSVYEEGALNEDSLFECACLRLYPYGEDV